MIPLLIGEICRERNLTKKAVEYYEQQGFIKPETGPNGYRVYTDADAAILREIALLRKLNLSIPEIRVILESPDKCRALENYKSKMHLQVHQIKARIECIDHLIAGGYNLAESEIHVERSLDENAIIKDRLERAFPGNYGIFLSLHFGRFLHEKIDSAEKAAAFDKIISFLDHVENIEIPKDLADLLNETYRGLKRKHWRISPKASTPWFKLWITLRNIWKPTDWQSKTIFSIAPPKPIKTVPPANCSNCCWIFSAAVAIMTS